MEEFVQLIKAAFVLLIGAPLALCAVALVIFGSYQAAEYVIAIGLDGGVHIPPTLHTMMIWGCTLAVPFIVAGAYLTATIMANDRPWTREKQQEAEFARIREQQKRDGII